MSDDEQQLRKFVAGMERIYKIASSMREAAEAEPKLMSEFLTGDVMSSVGRTACNYSHVMSRIVNFCCCCGGG